MKQISWTIALFIHFVLAIRLSFYCNPETEWNVVRVWRKGNPYPLIDLCYLYGGPNKGEWHISLTDQYTGTVAHTYSNYNPNS